MKKIFLKIYLLTTLLFSSAIVAERNTNEVSTVQKAGFLQRSASFCFGGICSAGRGLKSFTQEITKQASLGWTNNRIQTIIANKLISPTTSPISYTSKSDSLTMVDDLIKKKLPYSLLHKSSIDLQQLVPSAKHLEELKIFTQKWSDETFVDLNINSTKITGDNATKLLDNLITTITNQPNVKIKLKDNVENLTDVIDCIADQSNISPNKAKEVICQNLIKLAISQDLRLQTPTEQGLQEIQITTSDESSKQIFLSLFIDIINSENTDLDILLYNIKNKYQELFGIDEEEQEQLNNALDPISIKRQIITPEYLTNSFLNYFSEHKAEFDAQLMPHAPQAKSIATILSGPIMTSVIHKACQIGHETFKAARSANLTKTRSFIKAAGAGLNLKNSISAIASNPDLPAQIIEQVLPTSEDCMAALGWKILLKDHVSDSQINLATKAINFGSCAGKFITQMVSGNFLGIAFRGVETILSGLMIKEKIFGFETAKLKTPLNIIKSISHYFETNDCIPLLWLGIQNLLLG